MNDQKKSVVSASIKKLRDGIRYHRDQKGDDRCWLDDNGLWSLLHNNTQAHETSLPSFEEMMRACRDFFLHRRALTPDPIPSDAKLDPKTWDDDLLVMTNDELEKEFLRLQHAIQTHQESKEKPLAIEDDRLLYKVLPEKLPADFRLPPEEDFLGEGKQPNAGCPSFWRSHETCPCKEHDLHRWGPCCNNK